MSVQKEENLGSERENSMITHGHLCPLTLTYINRTKEEAQIHLRSLKKKCAYSGHIYSCPHCHGFHVGPLFHKKPSSYTSHVPDYFLSRNSLY